MKDTSVGQDTFLFKLYDSPAAAGRAECRTFSWKGAGRQRRRASADRARPRSGREKAGPESTPPPGEPTSPWKAVQAWRGRRRAAGADRGRGRPCQTSGSASRANVVRFLVLIFRRGFARNHSYKGGVAAAGRCGG